MSSISPHVSCDPAVARMKTRLMTAPYEICLGRALHFTRSYRETEGLDPALRNAAALKRTLEGQAIRIEPDERIAGSKTERFLAGVLPVERGDFLRILQLEIDVLEKKRRPFHMTEADRALFRGEIVPYWSGRTVRDRKALEWRRSGVLGQAHGPAGRLREALDGLRFFRYVGRKNLRKILGASLDALPTPRRLRELWPLRNELTNDHPTPAVYCFDVQGHLCLGIDRVVAEGMESIAARIRDRRARLVREEPGNVRGAAFLEASATSLEAAIAYSERFADLATSLKDRAEDPAERDRLDRIARHCRQVPRKPASTFAEALQAAWMTQVVGEIQFGMIDVFAQGRADQYLYPLYRRDLDEGRITRDDAIALLQEWMLKLTANVAPVPELGMESNGVLCNSQHVLTIGGLLPDGGDGTNDLSHAILDAYDRMDGTVNQIAVRIHPGTPAAFLDRVGAVMRRVNGLSLHNDAAAVRGLLSDGMRPEDARDYCIVGCVETCGRSNMQGCVAAQEFTLPAVVLMALTGGRLPPPAPGQLAAYDSGDPTTFATFEHLFEAFERQLVWQLRVMVEAIRGKDVATRELLPAPYVSALTDGCIESARDVSDGGARYDFTTVVMKGLATTVDSLAAVKSLVYDRGEVSLARLTAAIRDDFLHDEPLRQRLVREAPKYGTGSDEADDLAMRVVDAVSSELSRHRNARGGRFRVSYFSYGNHVIDGFFLGATPDGRRLGQPISNGASPSNLVESPAGPIGAMTTVARIPPEKSSSGLALNIRFHPGFLEGGKLDTLLRMIRTYFDLGGMHVALNVVSAETLRDAQAHPERHRDLIVKVSGYSAAFTDLGRSIQDDIIRRVEFGREP